MYECAVLVLVKAAFAKIPMLVILSVTVSASFCLPRAGARITVKTLRLSLLLAESVYELMFAFFSHDLFR